MLVEQLNSLPMAVSHCTRAEDSIAFISTGPIGRSPGWSRAALLVAGARLPALSRRPAGMEYFVETAEVGHHNEN